MVLSPAEAAEENDKYIREQAQLLEDGIDAHLKDRWHSHMIQIAIPAPSHPDPQWETEILDLLSKRYVAVGWKIERRHEPHAEWLLKK